ncbi:MAG: tetratricopeptide repeat protein [Panacagrimonas sp.]
MKRRSSYKVTFLDRHGPAGALRLQALKYAVVVFGVSTFMFYLLGSLKLGLSGPMLLLFTLGGALTLAGAAMFVGLQLGNAAGGVASRVYMGGDNTPYEDQFSQEQALVMQRDYAGALALFEQKIAERPGEPRVRIAAADLYATHGGNPKRAAQLYKEVQRFPEIKSGQDVYVSNKLADLYLGPLNEPGRALVEFRRLIQLYPDSNVAKHARLALANLKPDVLQGGQAQS